MSDQTNNKKISSRNRLMSGRMRDRLMALFRLFLFVIVVLGGFLLYQVIAHGDEYSKEALELQVYSNQTISYQRGDIEDTNGTVLATSIAVYDVVLDCSQLLYKTSTDDETGEVSYPCIEPTVNALCQCFPELNRDELLEYIETNRERAEAKKQAEDNDETYTGEKVSQYYPLLDEVSYERIKVFYDMRDKTEIDPETNKEVKVNPYIAGVTITTVYKRTYPFGSLASSLIGFVNSEDQGRKGLEYEYDDQLTGINGRSYGYLNSENSFEKTVVPATNGNSLITTIDANVQSIVEEKIQEFDRVYSNNAREGDGFTNCAVLIMNPKTGAVIAMANYPDFDCNDPGNTDDLPAEYNADGSEKSDAEKLNERWQNYCISQTFEPGSVQKPLTEACGLETGTLSTDMTFLCNGFEVVNGQKIKCVNVYGHGEETMEGALMDSCNDSLMQMSYKIGVSNFTAWQQNFGMGQKTGIDLPGEADTSGVIYSEDSMTAIDLATNSFGQNFEVTMIQMASAFSSLINGGSYYSPYVVRKIVDENGNTVSNVSPTLVRKTVSEGTSETIRSYLENVVANGTGATAKVDGYSMGGKTGTAEKRPRGKGNYLVSFMGFAPADDPELLIYCVVDEPNVEDQAHSSYAQNIAREIMEEVLPYMGIEQDEETTGANADLDITGNNPPSYSLGIYPEEETAEETDEEAEADTGIPDDAVLAE